MSKKLKSCISCSDNQPEMEEEEPDRTPSPPEPVRGAAALVRPVATLARLPLTEAVARRLPREEHVFSPIQQQGPTMADIARATAQRVVDRLEAFEQSPTVRELRADLDSVTEEYELTRDRVDNLAESLDNLSGCHNELTRDVNLTIERMEDLRRQHERRLDELERVLAERSETSERLRDSEARLRMTEFCLLFVMCFAAVLLSLLLKLR